MQKYTLSATQEQFQIIVRALELFVRLQQGQLFELANPYILPLANTDYEQLEEKILELKKIMYPELDDKAYYSIKSKNVPDELRQAADIFEVIKHQLISDFNLNKDNENKIELTEHIQMATDKELPIFKKEF